MDDDDDERDLLEIQQEREDLEVAWVNNRRLGIQRENSNSADDWVPESAQRPPWWSPSPERRTSASKETSDEENNIREPVIEYERFAGSQSSSSGDTSVYASATGFLDSDSDSWGTASSTSITHLIRPPRPPSPIGDGLSEGPYSIAFWEYVQQRREQLRQNRLDHDEPTVYDAVTGRLATYGWVGEEREQDFDIMKCVDSDPDSDSAWETAPVIDSDEDDFILGPMEAYRRMRRNNDIFTQEESDDEIDEFEDDPWRFYGSEEQEEEEGYLLEIAADFITRYEETQENLPSKLELPDSEMLESIHAYVSDFYSTLEDPDEEQDEDEDDEQDENDTQELNQNPTHHQHQDEDSDSEEDEGDEETSEITRYSRMDGSALLTMGILLEEMTKEWLGSTGHLALLESAQMQIGKLSTVSNGPKMALRHLKPVRPPTPRLRTGSTPISIEDSATTESESGADNVDDDEWEFYSSGRSIGHSTDYSISRLSGDESEPGTDLNEEPNQDDSADADGEPDDAATKGIYSWIQNNPTMPTMDSDEADMDVEMDSSNSIKLEPINFQVEDDANTTSSMKPEDSTQLSIDTGFTGGRRGGGSSRSEAPKRGRKRKFDMN